MTRLAGTTTSRPLSPPDSTLPELRLLDVGLLADALADAWGTTVGAARIDYLDLAPGASLVLQATVVVNDRRTTAVVRCGAAVSDTARATGTPIPGLRAVVHGFPFDPDLPLLAATHTELRALVPGPVSACGPTVLSYVPGQRATLALAPYVLKTYGSSDSYLAARAALHLLGDGRALPTPGLVATLPDRRATLQPLVEGTPAAPREATALAGPAGRLLDRLHASHRTAATTRDSAAQLADARRSVAVVGSVLPHLRDRAAAVLTRLAVAAPTGLPLVLSHGDFTVDQLIVRADGGLVVTDVDTACMAPAALDVASFAANVMSGRPGDADHAAAVLAALVASCGSPPGLDWHLAVALLRRCDRPFRRLKKHWPQKATAILDMAEKVSRSWA